MKRIDLIPLDNPVKIGDNCPYFEPNITDDCIFYADGEPIGFYLTQMPERAIKLAELANKEFNSKNVPKSVMTRSAAVMDGYEKHGKRGTENLVEQMSCILGGIAPRPHMRRPYPTMSSVHQVKSAQTFIKAMYALALESEKLIKEITPNIYDKQVELFQSVPKQWRFGNLFTSSISNYNISAPFHRDTGNIKGAVNVIICKKHNSKGGDLHIPDYKATIGQQDNSILVFPAWRNVHAVTPITPTFEGGYRNSLVFYPLAAFLEK
jgi:hypothetical protein